MISQELQKAFNVQIAHEQANVQAYRAVACWFKRQNLSGFEKFFKKQAGEENTHAERLIHHVEERGGTVELAAIPAPKNDFASPADAVKFVGALERNTTRLATALYDQVLKANDHAGAIAIQWLISEQVEEEAWVAELEDLVAKLGSNPATLYMLDAQWGGR